MNTLKFRSVRYIVEGGVQKDNADDVVEYAVAHVYSEHADGKTVLVRRAADWWRSEDWIGFVHNDNFV